VPLFQAAIGNVISDQNNTDSALQSRPSRDRAYVRLFQLRYTWIVVVGAIGAVFTAYGIGANDLANAFASSVGSGALNIPQAVAIAAVFEFLGAFLLGGRVVDTVRSKILNVEVFYDRPEVTASCAQHPRLPPSALP